ncbi:RNA polymerase sigma factor [Sphingomonas carotinifaciens]|uniref:RNA polymerase sigma factor n=1 Tax=Sphingomonas carotinifaciens TaxID=1166323 RepID=UPI0017BC6BD8|nr:RNA polymerase sigma factor [Sphingomonas carotinifaciens]MBB4088140.1 RNA polymerase sigma-70 factor (ECF subfamily) [Sphingomonas carotinifaciens]
MNNDDPECLPTRSCAAPALEAAFLSHRAELISFFHRRGHQLDAEDLLHEVWLRLPADGAHIKAPLAYMYSIANSLIIKRYHESIQGRRRDRAWGEATGPATPDCSDQPDADRVLQGKEEASRVLAALAKEGERVFRAFHRHRVDGLTQREIAEELGVSLRTVESDLARARLVVAALRKSADDLLLSI